MAYFNWGNRPIFSTSAPTAAPSTATVVAFLDSTQLGTASFQQGQSMCVFGRAALKASTLSRVSPVQMVRLTL